MSLTQQDITRLIHEPSTEARTRIASKVADSFNRMNFTERESAIAIEIFRLLVRDTSASIRRTLAEQLSHNPHVPRDIVLQLALDDADIAESILEHSLILSEEDLISLIKATREVKKWLAISRRRSLPRDAALALVETRHIEVIGSLLANVTAKLYEGDIEQITAEYAHEQPILEALISRGGLSPDFSERLYAQVSDRLTHELTKRYRFNWKVAREQTQTARITSMLKFLSPWLSDWDRENLITRMHQNKRLNYSIALRALCLGETDFFEMCMARLAGISLQNTRILLRDPGELAFCSLCKKSDMPEGFCQAVQIVYRCALETSEGGSKRLPDFTRRMIDRLTSEGYDQRVENMGYFLSIMEQNKHGCVTLH